MTLGTSTPLPPSSAVVTVGDELLVGQTMDGNGHWLAREISGIGLPVVGRWVVGDVAEEIHRALGSALELAEVVVVTGGLGPTPDDLTREAVAGFMGVPLDLDAGLLEKLEARFRARGYGTLPERSKAMAMVPRGGTVLANPIGAAPGVVFEPGAERLCILLPGVPKEMRAIFQDGVRPLLLTRYAGRLRPAIHRVIHTVGVPESILMAQLQELLPEEMGGVSMAYLPDQVGVRLRLTARAEGDPNEGESRLQMLEDRLAPVLSRYRYEASTGDLAEAVGAALFRGGDFLAVAESCTGGLIAKRMTDIPGSSRYFVGGVVAYANEVKTRSLGVSEDLIRQFGVVSEAVAGALAEGASRSLGASVGLGVTGVAGPGGGSPEKPVGTVCYAVCRDGRTVTRKELFLGDRDDVRARSAHAALGLLLRFLEGRESP